MQLIRRKSSMGALGRRFERDREFQACEQLIGPAFTPAGTDNAALSLRFGRFPPNMPPARRSIGRFGVIFGKNAAKWAKLSDIDGNFLVLGDRIALTW